MSKGKLKLNKFHNVWSRGSSEPAEAPITFDIIEVEEGVPALHFVSDGTPIPNISSHIFVDAMGYNTFTTRGVALLKLFKLLEDETFDNYYKIRGGIVETLAVDYLKSLYPGCNATGHELYDFKGFNQFPEAKPFSSVADITITDPFKMSVEVKSKNQKNATWIIGKKDYPQQEVKQGEFIAELFGADTYMMLWGFVSVSLEFRIQNLLSNPEKIKPFERIIDDKIVTYDFEKLIDHFKLTYTSPHITWHHQIYDVDHERIRKEMRMVLDMRNNVLMHQGIPISEFTKEEFKDIIEDAF